mmetsp:Transcript_115112/g.221839  ORF Transcript_115112/g.221839 Transcript_115112/m.221839 type:complete len:247 (-) Transcript_115112:57-797(-)
MDKADLCFLALSPLCTLCFGFTCLLFFYIDTRRKPQYLVSVKLQEKPPPSTEDYAQLLPIVLGQNGFIAVVVSPPFVLWAFRQAGVTITRPSVPQMLFEIVAMTMIYDTWFWALHRLFHLPRFYRFHKLHHQWKAPCALEGAYFDPLDFVIGNYGPMLFLPLLVTKHYMSVLAFGCLGVISVAITHSGYDLQSAFWFLGPLVPSTRHDRHHEFFDVNFSTFGILDYLTGTFLSQEAGLKRRSKRVR